MYTKHSNNTHAYKHRDGKLSGEAADAIKAQLVASMGQQNMLIYLIEGVREISLGVASGLAFVWTGNLAAPFAGSVLMQVRGLVRGMFHGAGGARLRP